MVELRAKSFPKFSCFCLNCHHFQELSPSSLLRTRHATLTTIFFPLATHLAPSPSLHKIEQFGSAFAKTGILSQTLLYFHEMVIISPPSRP
ncbi:unnamed protein product [Gulo gulo]|uniref:Uncharacterized protein n=1 Tax=Gulo gulo TaxID=48420 RepID=A0A9X9M8B8_GULGU|nr:unnamed protein product [Gulo gulo]